MALQRFTGGCSKLDVFVLEMLDQDDERFVYR